MIETRNKTGKPKKDWQLPRQYASSKANMEKVAKVVLENPNLTQQQIADKAWISVGNVNDKLTKLENSWIIGKDPRISAICDEDINIVSKANKVRAGYVDQVLVKLLVKELLAKGDFKAIHIQWYISDRMLELFNNWEIDSSEFQSSLERLRRQIVITKDEVNAIDKISDTSQKRYSIFMGSITDEHWWFNKLSEATTDDLWKKFNDLLWKEQDGVDWSGANWEGVID